MSEVKVSLSAKDEIALMNRYGRKCLPQTLVKRALAEVLKQQAENIPIFVGKEEHEANLRAEDDAKRLVDAEAANLPPAVEGAPPIAEVRAAEEAGLTEPEEAE